METLTGLQLYTQQTAMHCAFGILSITTSVSFFSSLSYSSLSVGLDRLVKDTDYCRPGTSPRRSSFGDVLTQSSNYHKLALINLAQIFKFADSSRFQHKCQQNVNLLPNISLPLTSTMMKR
ncbi:hypothetical protein ILYODFUR_007669 [Ilyodon furcidens]|uniref:Uncharacterized protein n=1 Tax=Ilyodon furcidens TaxID=33524 RepID=A0ABV0UG10_9TELE